MTVTPSSTNPGPVTISTSQIRSSAVQATLSTTEGIEILYLLTILDDIVLTQLKQYDSSSK